MVSHGHIYRYIRHFKINCIFLASMQKHNHIKVIFFIGIFSMFLLHQVVPHLHHQHQDSHSHNSVALNNDHDHHHAPEKEDNPKSGFIDFFLTMHVHSSVSNEILITKENVVKQTVVRKNIIQPFSPNYNIVYNDYGEVDKRSIYHPPKNYFNLYLICLDLRGPPSLG